MIHICVRKTLDWGNEAVVSERLRPTFRAKYEMWNATFDMPYACFRRRLKEIAELNLSRVENVSLTSLDDVPPGELIVPVDDDDWFAPDLITELQKILEPERAGYLWVRDVIEPPRRRRRFRFRLRRKRRPDLYTCSTNNYAVVNEPELLPLASSHKRASEYFDENPMRMGRIGKTLAVQNRNLASQTALAWKRPTITHQQLLDAHARYSSLYASWKLPRYLRWARPYVEKMDQLMREIGIR